MEKKNFVTRWLESSNAVMFNGYCILAAFSTYFCMYAFRKPFAAGEFAGKAGIALIPLLDYKTILIICQLIGYTLSKYIGIKVISEMGKTRRALAIISMIVFAELSLLGFALIPKPYNIICLFLNGIPLGMIWGLVFGFLEGRRSTEVLGVGLSASYIVASGVVKSVGRWVMSCGVPEVWMPAVSGLIFFPFMLIFVYMLRLIPYPTKEDEELRTARRPMGAKERKLFFNSFAPGLIALVVLYMFLTAYRDFRDNFAVELWSALGYGKTPSILTFSELPIAFGVMVVLALVMIIRNNKRALLFIHAIMLAGSLLIGLSTMAFEAGLIGPVSWMIAVGLGLYVGYVPYGCILFDRLIAYVGVVATAGFMIYVADALGYSASVFVLLYKNFGHPNLDWLNFFISFSYATAIVCSVSFVFSLVYFSQIDVAEKQKSLVLPEAREAEQILPASSEF